LRALPTGKRSHLTRRRDHLVDRSLATAATAYDNDVSAERLAKRGSHDFGGNPEHLLEAAVAGPAAAVVAGVAEYPEDGDAFRRRQLPITKDHIAPANPIQDREGRRRGLRGDGGIVRCLDQFVGAIRT